MKKQNRPRTTNVQILAKLFIGELGLTALDPEGKPWTARGLYQAHGKHVQGEIGNVSAGNLGIIGAKGLSREWASQKGRTSFWDVCDEKIRLNFSGRAPLRIIATRTIIAAMYDILRARGDDGGVALQCATSHSLESDSASRNDKLVGLHAMSQAKDRRLMAMEVHGCARSRLPRRLIAGSAGK